jgi:RHS repeat-associated protein
MLRTLSTVSARTLTRSVRTRRASAQSEQSRSTKLRFDTLESREQPGSVWSGLTAAGMVEPLQVIAAAIGPNALTKEPLGRQSADNLHVGATPLAPISHDADRSAAPAGPALRSDSTASPATTVTTAANASATNLSDLSIADPAMFNPPALDRGSIGAAGGSGGSAAGAAASGAAGQSLPDDRSSLAGRSGQAGGDGVSLANPASNPPAAPVAGAPAVRAVVHGASTGRPAETFVTPPSDVITLEPPAPKQHRTAAIATSTDPIFAVGTDAGTLDRVKVYDAQTQALLHTFIPFVSTAGVRVAVADVTGDGTADVVVGQGPGAANKVKVYDGATGLLVTSLGTLTPFTTAQSDGVWVASDDVTGDGKADIVVGTDGNFAPQVKVYSGADGSLVRTINLSDLGISGGVPVAAGDVNGDGHAEVIVGSGPGKAAQVAAYDGSTGMQLYDYLPFGAGYFGGVTLAAGDVTGDGAADIVVGQATGGDQVKVFSGADTTSTWNLAAFGGSSGGVRVGVADVDADGKDDILTSRGPGGGETRAYAAADGGQVFSLTPFGAGFDKGLFVAGDARPVAVFTTFTVTPTVTISTDLPAVTEGAGSVYPFTLTRDDSSTFIMVHLSFGGTATAGTGSGTDYLGTALLPMTVGVSSIPVPVTFSDDTLLEGPESVVCTVTSGSGYNVGSPSSGSLVIEDNDGPSPAAPVAAAMSNCVNSPAFAPGTPGSVVLPYNPATDTSGPPVMLPAYGGDEGGPIQAYSNILPYFPGQDNSPPPTVLPAHSGDQGGPITTMLEVSSTGVGTDGSIVCSSCPAFANTPWSNTAQFSTGGTGNGRELPGLPSLIVSGSVVSIRGCGTDEVFDLSGGTYTARDGDPSNLTHDGTAHTYTLTDSTGAQTVFYDTTTVPAAQQGMLQSQSDPAGNGTGSTTYNGSGQLTSRKQSVTTGGVTTSLVVSYTYYTTGANSGRLATAILGEQIGAGSITTIRTAAYTYYDGTTGNGTLGDLQTVVIEDPATNVLETHYFRYYTSNTAPGYTGGLKYQVTGAAYDRAAAWGAAQTTPLTVDQMSDAQLAPFADLYLEFDATHRVTRLDAQAGGCSVCSGGIGTFTYSYAASPFATGYNSWLTKRTETRPDGTTRVTYSNYVGEPVLEVHQEGGQNWATFYKYDTAGRLILAAAPSAVSGYDESKADLVNNQSGNYQYLRDSQGLIETFSYYSSTTATSTTAGGVAGYLNQTGLQRGETGTSVLQGTTDYISRTAGGRTVYPVADATVYRNTNGTGGETTSATYTWNTGSVLPASATVTLPTVTTGENGPGTATSLTAVFDAYGRVQWTKDAGGFLTYFAYDDLTGAVTKVIQDVDTTQTSTFTNLPSGWSTPSGGGLHLTTTDEVDLLGRVTKATSPAGNVTYTVFNDAGHEVRVYAGWDSTTHLPTGPAQVYREDRARGYTEALTMSATPNLSSGRPDGTETIASVESLSRNVLNNAGQVVDEDEYVTLSGTSYSQSSVTLGTSGTNYNRTQQAYDHLGRPNKTVSPSGTIYRTEYDGLGRVVSEWVGTDDTPTTGFWSPSNLAGTDMVNTVSYEYDSGGVGDGLLTKDTQHPGGGAADRVTATAYDWRDRPVADKAGVETSESTSVHRPISYHVLDNLGEVTETDAFNGDGVSITTDANGDGVPDAPSSGRVAKSTADYDELGRADQEKTFSVDPSTGMASTNALTINHWFDSRGNEIKTSNPGGEVDKTVFDGAGRATTTYVTDGGGDSAYSDAGTVTGDAVLSQTETTYDKDGNVTFTVDRERFHDETTTGALGTPSTGVHARVSYQAMYYDKADRLTDSVDVGTNGGSAYTRPSTPDSRSDSVLVTGYGYNSAGEVESVTDPRGLVDKTYFDLAGRTTKTVENYVDGTVSDTDDKTTEYTYDASGQVATLRADLTGGGYQETKWVYGITSPVVSNDVVKEMQYPDPSTGAASSSQKDQYTYNQLGQVLTRSDRNGTVHTYSYDVLGRVTADAVTTLGSGVDGAVRRIETAYDTQGNPYLVTSYDAATSGTVVNQIQRAYDGLGQLTQEWQATSGTVNTSTTPSVQYAYAFAPSGSNNTDRLTSITYPNGRVITYNYASGLSDTISRLSSISDGGTTLESYQYLGLGMVVTRAHPQTGVDLTYVKLTGESNGAAGDQYTGLDAFGRVVDQRWTTSGGTAADRRQYGYDRDSNRLYANNLVSTSNSELYTYDGLNQLSSFQRGTLNGTKTGLTGSASRSQSWDFDAVGNFDSQTTDGTTQTRSDNKQNEITAISGATTPTYDSNGSLTTDETGKTLKYDAWNRLVQVKNSGGTTLATYQYDGGGQRVRETRGGTTTDLYYSNEWQVLEERVGGTATTSYVWSPVYVDSMVARDRDTNSDGTLDERLYAAQDANFNVTALINTSGTVVERYQYDPYGGFSVLDGSWGARGTTSYGWKYLYQGGRWDADGTAYSFRNREYRPTLGRWLQNDPIGFTAGDANLYRFLSNAPQNAVDPIGLAPNLQGGDDRIGKAVNDLKAACANAEKQIRFAVENGLNLTQCEMANLRGMSDGLNWALTEFVTELNNSTRTKPPDINKVFEKIQAQANAYRWLVAKMQGKKWEISFLPAPFDECTALNFERLGCYIDGYYSGLAEAVDWLESNDLGPKKPKK